MSITLQPLVQGFVSCIALSVSPFDPDGLYIVDQPGLIYRYDKPSQTVSLFLDLQNEVMPLESDYEERGLLGLAFSPTDPDRFYIFYTARNNVPLPPGILYNNVVGEVYLSPDGTTVTPLLTIPCDHTFHNGGNLVIGPDGYLYIGVGDGGPQGAGSKHSQDLHSLHGKLLRIDVSTPGTYHIPSDNPFHNEIYAYGIRNAWGTSFDSQGRLFMSDCGYNTVEELDIIVKGGNYGWPLKEGTMVSPWTDTKDLRSKQLIDPIYEYRHGVECGQRSLETKVCCIVGGYYVDGLGYIGGDYSGMIFLLQEQNGKWDRVLQEEFPIFVKGFGKDLDDNVYVLTSENPGPKGTTGGVSLVSIA